MGDLEVKPLDSPDETKTFDKGKIEVGKVGDAAIGRVTLEPGWRWSECVKPMVGTDSCQAPHTGYVVAGRLHVVMDDGRETELGPGDAHWIAPGHDAWVVGDQAYVGLDFTGAAKYAK